MHDLAQDLAGWTIAFDLDGTLVESAPDLVGTVNTMLEEDGLPPVSFADGRLMIGHGAGRLIQRAYLQGGTVLPDDRLPEMVERFVVAYGLRIADHSHAFPGCVEALAALKARGATLSVCTNKRTGLSVQLLDALGMTHWFAAVIGADSAPAPKPDPRHLLVAIEAAGGDPARAILVGDTSADTLAAQAAKVPCIVVDFGYSQTPATQLGGDRVIGAFSELEAVVEAIAATCRPAVDSL